jgi:hypothetical protein
MSVKLRQFYIKSNIPESFCLPTTDNFYNHFGLWYLPKNICGSFKPPPPDAVYLIAPSVVLVISINPPVIGDVRHLASTSFI